MCLSLRPAEIDRIVATMSLPGSWRTVISGSPSTRTLDAGTEPGGSRPSGRNNEFLTVVCHFVACSPPVAFTSAHHVWPFPYSSSRGYLMGTVTSPWF